MQLIIDLGFFFATGPNPLVLRDGHTRSSEVEVVGIEDDVAFKHVGLDDDVEDDVAKCPKFLISKNSFL